MISNRPKVFSTLWIFVLMNYMYCDILGLMDATVLQKILSGNIDGIEMSENFLLYAAILMEIPMAMILLSRVLNSKVNKIANIIAGAIMTVVQIGSLFVGSSTMYYRFFSTIEISTTILIMVLALKWKQATKDPDFRWA